MSNVVRFPSRQIRGERTAVNHAVFVRRQIGRDLIDRNTDKIVRVVSVTVEPIQ